MAMFFTKIGGCSRKIRQAVNAANHPILLDVTLKGLRLVLSKPGQTRIIADIGYKRLSRKLMAPLQVPRKSEDLTAYKGQRLLFRPYIEESGLIKECLSLLIEQGPDKSREVLRSNGISVCENVDIITIRDLADFTYARLKDRISCTIEASTKIGNAISDLRKKTSDMKDSLLHEQYDKMAAFLKELADSRNSALSAGLSDALGKIQEVIDTLSFLPQPERKFNTAPGLLTVWEIADFISAQLNIIREGMFHKITDITACLKNIDKTIAELQTKARSPVDVDITLAKLSGQLAIMPSYLVENHTLIMKVLKLTDNLTNLAIRCQNEKLTIDLRNSIFNKKEATR